MQGRRIRCIVTDGSCSPIPQFDSHPNTNPALHAAAFVGGTAGGALYHNAFPCVNTATSSATLKAPSPQYVAGSGLTVQAESGQRA